MNSAASADLTESIILRTLNDAHQEACRLAYFRRSVEFSIDTVAGDRGYPIPPATVHDRIIQIRYGDGTTFVPLTMLQVPRFLDLFQDGAERGTPKYYAVIPGTRQIWIGPTPDQSLIGGLRVIAQPMPEPLSRMCQSSAHAVTAAITSGGTTVTLSGSLAAEIMPGDEFGVVPTVQSDASQVIEASPQVWYTVATVPSPIATLTLAEPYTGPTASAASFIVAQVPSIEFSFPGQYGSVIPQLAAARILTTRDPNLSDRLRQDALQVFDSQMDTSFRAVFSKTGVGRTTLARPY